MKEMCNLTLLSRASLCIRRVGGKKEKEDRSEDGGGILTAIHRSPLLLLSFTDNLTGDNDDDSDGGDQRHLLHIVLITIASLSLPHPLPHSLMLLLIQSLVRATRW